MKALAHLMQEHRLIEKMLKLAEVEMRRINELHQADPVFVDLAIDFIRTYAELAHHGKEEEILFQHLARKSISPEQARVLNELLEEHKYAKNNINKLIELKARYQQGENVSEGIQSCLKDFAQFYPKHIEKEDKHFFCFISDYFNEVENDKIIQEFVEFDAKIMNWHYRKVTGILEERLLNSSS
jgi:hemerythrin-like domain-containing protein